MNAQRHKPDRKSKQRRRLGDALQFGCSAIGLWAFCALGIYLIKPAEPQLASSVAVVSHVLTEAQAASARGAEIHP